MRAYGRETGLEKVPLKLLQLAEAGHWKQADELRITFGIHDLLDSMSLYWGIKWLNPTSGMDAYHMTMTRPHYWLEGWTLSLDYHDWRSRRAGEELGA